MSVLVVAALLIIFVLIPNLVKNNQAKASYRKALELMNSGQYQAAAEKFEECDDYSDAQDLARQSYYAQAERLFDNNDYEQAAGFYQKAGSYSNASEQYSECMYQIGLDRMGQQDNGGAAEAFIKAGIDYKEIKRYICSNAALSQTVPFSEYSLADRVIDTLYYDYGQSVISNISNDGIIDGTLNGNYTYEEDSLFVTLSGVEVEEVDDSFEIVYRHEDRVADAFLAFIKHVYGIDSPEVTNSVRIAVQHAQEVDRYSFNLLQESGLVASIWSESNNYMMNCGTEPIQLTPLERKGQNLVDSINQAVGENVAVLDWIDDDQETIIWIKLFCFDDGTCLVEGTYDDDSANFIISRMEIQFLVDNDQDKSSYIGLFENMETVLCGIIEGTLGLPINSSEKDMLKDALSQAAEEWYQKGVENNWDTEALFMEQTEAFDTDLAGIRYEFEVSGIYFRSELMCYGYSF